MTLTQLNNPPQPLHARQRAIITIQKRRKYATLVLNPFHLVLSFPKERWDRICRMVKSYGLSYRFGPEALYVQDVPLAVADKLAQELGEIAAEYCSQSSLWL